MSSRDLRLQRFIVGCEEPTGPARSGRPDDKLRDEAIQFCRSVLASLLDCFACARNDREKRLT